MNGGQHAYPTTDTEINRILRADALQHSGSPPVEPSDRPPIIRSGVIAGLIAGLALSLFMTAINLFTGQDIWAGAKIPAYPFISDAALRPGFEAGPVFLGLLSHFAISVFWAIPFAFLAIHRSRKVRIALGLTWGIGVWFIMYYFVLPSVGAGLLAQMMPLPFAIFEHMFYGLTLALSLRLTLDRPVQERVPQDVWKT